MWRGHCIKKLLPFSQQLCVSAPGVRQFSSELIVEDEFFKPLNSNPEISNEATIEKIQQLVAPEGEFGLTSSMISHAIKKCPDLLTLRPIDIASRLKTLQIHLNTEEMHQMLISSPQTLMVPGDKLKKQVEKLLDTSGLTRKEVRSLLLYSGQYFNNYVQSKKKLDYLHLIIGETDYDVKTLISVANVQLEHMKVRHEFLSRRGQHFAPDRHGSTKIVNPTVPEMILSSDKYFCEKVAFCDQEEFNLFCKIFQHEEDLLKFDLGREEFSEEDDTPSDFADMLIQTLKGGELVKGQLNAPSTPTTQ